MDFSTITRENTGKHFLDSGDHYGRHYERPIPENDIQIEVYNNFVSASLSLTHALNEMFYEHDLNKSFKEFDADHPKDSYEDNVKAFLEQQGYVHVVTENTYNYGTDLDQELLYSIYQKEGAKKEWYWDDETVYVIRSHNGCDVRGGYSTPVLCSLQTENFNEFIVGWSFVNGITAEGEKIEREDLQSLDEHFQSGYTSCPTYDFNEEIEKVLKYSEKHNWVYVQLKSGERVIAVPNWYCY